MTHSTDTAAWTGWHRRQRWEPWRRVCEAESWQGCWDLLGATVQGGDLVVLGSGENPNRPRQPITEHGHGDRRG